MNETMRQQVIPFLGWYSNNIVRRSIKEIATQGDGIAPSRVDALSFRVATIDCGAHYCVERFGKWRAARIEHNCLCVVVPCSV